MNELFAYETRRVSWASNAGDRYWHWTDGHSVQWRRHGQFGGL